MVVSSEGLFYSYTIDLDNGGECVLNKQYSLLDSAEDSNDPSPTERPRLPPGISAYEIWSITFDLGGTITSNEATSPRECPDIIKIHDYLEANKSMFELVLTGSTCARLLGHP
ncbi:unnamed protein product [Rhizoctonia solani]|uniref:Uncharacterized protein n=1 Tax=Rhizoctonia solani TaxID=456999 RepID=A0A8H2XMA5_9AGAM|nr:unnamed protein product [Rhizoctonia solani]